MGSVCRSRSHGLVRYRASWPCDSRLHGNVEVCTSGHKLFDGGDDDRNVLEKARHVRCPPMSRVRKGEGDEAQVRATQLEETDATPSLKRQCAAIVQAANEIIADAREPPGFWKMLIRIVQNSSIHQSQRSCSRDPFPFSVSTESFP